MGQAATTTEAARARQLSYEGAEKLLGRLAAAAIAEEPGTRPRLYVVRELLTLLEQPVATPVS